MTRLIILRVLWCVLVGPFAVAAAIVLAPLLVMVLFIFDASSIRARNTWLGFGLGIAELFRWPTAPKDCQCIGCRRHGRCVATPFAHKERGA
jgi:hypothetical protein